MDCLMSSWSDNPGPATDTDPGTPGENREHGMQFVLLWSQGEPFIIIRMPKYPLALTLMTHKGSHLLPIALSHTLLLETYYNFSYKLTGWPMAPYGENDINQNFSLKPLESILSISLTPLSHLFYQMDKGDYGKAYHTFLMVIYN